MGITLSDRQARIRDLLRSLISYNAADFYVSAVAAFTDDPPRPGAVHLIAHCLREVDGAIREVLEPTEKVAGHRNSIREVLKVLGIDENAPVAMFWFSIGEKDGPRSLPGFAHRRSGRSRQMDEDFRALFAGLEEVFAAVLERYRHVYVEVVNRLDQLLITSNPGRADVVALNARFPANLMTRQYFFARAGSAWLAPLHLEDQFGQPPEPAIDDEDGTISNPVWPEGDYLLRVAEELPAEALEAAKSVPVTDNMWAVWNLIKVALLLPAESAVELAGTITASVPGRFGMVAPQSAAELVVHLAAGGYTDEATLLAQALLADVPPTRQRRAASGLSGYDYGEALTIITPALASADGGRLLSILCDLLDQAITVATRAGITADPGSDDGWMWRPILEKSLRYDEHDPRNQLTDAVRSGAIRAVNDGHMDVADLVALWRSHPRPIFVRMSMDLLRDHGSDAPDLVTELLLNLDLMSDRHVEREYLMLAAATHGDLELPAQRRLVALVDAGPAPNWTAGIDESDQVRRRGLIERWQRNRYAAVEDLLSPAELARYETLVLEHGPAPEIATAAGQVLEFSSRRSPLTDEEFVAMTGEELVEFLRTWTPSPPGTWPPVDRDDLRFALSAAVESAADMRSSQASRFIGLPADVVTTVVEALGRAAHNDQQLQWANLIPLQAWINEQANAELTAGVVADDQRRWLNARKAILLLLISALNSDADDLDLEQIWSIIEDSTHDPNPRPDQPDAGPERLDIYSARTRALRAATAFGAHLRIRNPAADLSRSRSALDGHLRVDVDPSLAMRYTYGDLFNVLLKLDPGWLAENRNTIFPTDEAMQRYWAAAWHGFVRRFTLTDDGWTLMRPLFDIAVGKLISDTTDEWELQRASFLGHHLLRRYWLGDVTLNDADQLLRRFYSLGPPPSFAKIIRSIAMSLPAATPLQPDLHDRLVAFWEFRIQAVDAGAKSDELDDFPLWFNSGAFADDWSLRQLLIALKRSRTVGAHGIRLWRRSCCGSCAEQDSLA